MVGRIGWTVVWSCEILLFYLLCVPRKYSVTELNGCPFVASGIECVFDFGAHPAVSFDEPGVISAPKSVDSFGI